MSRWDKRGYGPAGLEFVAWMNAFLRVFQNAPAPGVIERRVPDGMRVYCVGDIHGRDDLLEQMAERVASDIEDRSFGHALTVFLGDYVDRGLGSMQVVERFVRGEWPTAVIPLAGNHEDLLTAFLEDERVFDAWRSLGGLETLHSYGVDVGGARAGRDFARNSNCLRDPVSRTAPAIPRKSYGLNSYR